MDFIKQGEFQTNSSKINELPEQRLFKYIMQTISAINLLHENQVVFRNLSLNSMLIDENDDIKLIDFSLATNKTADKKVTFSEAFNNSDLIPQDIKNSLTDFKIDIWTLGVLLYELIFGKFLYKTNQDEKINLNFDLSNSKLSVSNECIDLMKSK